MIFRAGWALLALCFAASRLFDLEKLPLFLDEALHIVWSARAFEPSRLIRHVNDGKLLQVYLFSALLPWTSEPVWLARACSGIAGFFGMVGAQLIGRRLYGPRVGWLAALAYLVSPYALFHDRMALADVYVSTLSGLSLLASLRLAERPGAGRAIVVALALAATTLAKMTGVLSAAIPVLTLLLLGTSGARRWLPLVGGLFASIVGLPLFYFAKRARVYGHLADAVGEHGAAAAPELASDFGVRFLGELVWLQEYWTWPLLLAAGAGLSLAVARRDRKGILLGMLAIVPLAAFPFVSGHIFPRYLVASIIPTAILVGSFGDALWRRFGGRLAVAALLALAAPALRFDALLLRDPLRAPLPEIERGQYLMGWQSGYGVVDAAQYLRGELARNREGMRLVLHTNSERAINLILRAYLMNQPALEITDRDLADPRELQELRQGLGLRPTFVALGVADPGAEKTLDPSGAFDSSERLHEWTRPTGERVVTLYRLAAPPP